MALRLVSSVLGCPLYKSVVGGTISAAPLISSTTLLLRFKTTAQQSTSTTVVVESTTTSAATNDATSTVSADGSKVAFTFDEPLDYVSSGGVVVDEDLDPETGPKTPLHTRLAERLDGRHFVSADVNPSIESTSRIGGPGVASMADMVDVVAGAFSGEQSRVSKAVADLAQGVPGPSRASQVSQAWTTKAISQPAPEDDQDVLDYCMKHRARGL